MTITQSKDILGKKKKRTGKKELLMRKDLPEGNSSVDITSDLRLYSVCSHLPAPITETETD